MANMTWTLLPHPADTNIISVKWLFRQKYKENGTLERYKASWVVYGFSLLPDMDLGDTFYTVVKSATIRNVLALAAARDWPVHQMNVNNAVLQGFLTENVYCQ